MQNPKMRQVREFIRSPYAWPGGYPLVLIMSDGEALCSQCARDNYRLISEATRGNDKSGWGAEGVEIHWEGAPMICTHCGIEIESAYGNPEEA